MKLDELEKMAQQTAAFGVHPSGEYIYSFYTEQLQAFAALVASAERERLTDAAMKAAEKAVDVAVALEREACAKIVEESSLPDAYSQECMPDIANDIRARKNNA